MELQTKVPVAPSCRPITHQDAVVLVGSCFSDHISARFADGGFRVLGNPFGTLYNPMSIAACLLRALDGLPMGEEDLVQHGGLWHSWLHHGRFSHPDRQECLARCDASLQETAGFLRPGSTLVVTFGTAYIFRLHDGRFVANCHKLPAANFVRERISVESVVSVWQPLLRRLSERGIRVLFTVSPIRHLSDTAHGNQLSKSTLLLAVDSLCGMGEADYFPAYEIVLDELRDYRFYDKDMVHPSELAADIVWQRFMEAYMTKETCAICEKFHRLHKMKAHRPLYLENDASHQERVRALENELKTYCQ